MPVALALLTLGVLLTVSGLKGTSLVDTLAGGIGGSFDPGFSPTTAAYDGLSGSQAQSTVNPAANLTQSAYVGGSGSTVIDGKPVAKWIVPILMWARANGWPGRVTSGVRSQGEQNFLRANPSQTVFPAGKNSNHVGDTYPKGAVDVTEPEKLAKVLQGYPGSPTLVWGGPVIGDRVHFSANGR